MISTWPGQQVLRWRPPAGTIPLVVLVLLLVLAIANSTVAANWVPGSGVLTETALLAALLMAALAVARRVPSSVALAIGGLLAPLVALVASHGTLTRAHPEDSTDLLQFAGAWLGRIASGDAVNDVAFYLYLLCLLFWVIGGWLSWCSVRWRQPLLGLVPGALAFATNVLNFPTDQNGYTLAFLVLTLGLLLWASYVRSLQSASARRVRMSSDARWDFWESGMVVMAAVVALGIFIPPLSTSDRTVDIESGSFRGWAELQQRLNHPVAVGRGSSSGTSTGLASLVRLGGPVHKTSGAVFTYTIDGAYSGPRYFRGFNLESTAAGPGGAAWRYTEQGAQTVPLEKDATPPYAEGYNAIGSGSVKVQMLKPPDRATDVLFYPGTLLKVDRTTTAHSSRGNQPPPGVIPAERIETVDRVAVPARGGSTGTYKVTSQYSNATEEQLRAASTDYPGWLDPYRNFGGFYRGAGGTEVQPLSGTAYRSRQTLQRIQELARKVTEGRDDPYDQAAAIEAYLRSNYQYTLTPTEPPKDTDPLEYFLFTSKEGYCEYFASAMGDMLRSLGIPTRLVNGYGSGTYDEHLGRYVVREADAHTWVEAYFPGYGWIPFEPTPDGTYFPIPRGSTGVVCAPDSEVCDLGGDTSGAGGDAVTRPDKGELDAGDTGVGGGAASRSPVPGGFPLVALVIAALVIAAWLALARYLRPRTVGAVWKRTSLLSALAGVRSRPSETPIEFGARLAREIPEAAQPARQLSETFAVAAYAPRDVAIRSRTAAMAAWEELRPLLLRRVRGRLRLAS